MKKLALATVALLAQAGAAASQTAEQLVGVWTVVTIENVAADGKRSPAFGENPITQLILTSSGHFSQFFMRSDVPKFASNNRLTGTPEENTAVVKGANASVGTYTLADKVVTLTMQGATFPNWIGTAQKRPIVKLTSDELVWTVPLPSGGGQIETHWKRVK